MSYKTTPVEVYRLFAAQQFEDPDYIKVATYDLRVQPFTGDEASHANQVMQNIRDLIVSDDPDIDIRKSDELYYPKYKEWSRVQYIQRFRMGIMPHTEIYTADSQWKRNG